MNRLGLLLAGLALGWAGSCPAQSETPAAEEDVGQLLARMSRAVHFLNYEGDFVYAHGSVLEAMRMAHTEQDGYEREQIITLSGRPHQIVRDNYTVTRVLPDRPAAVEDRYHGPGAPRLVSFDPERVGRSYEFKQVGEGRVAARVTRQVAILPTDGKRYGYRLHVDAKYALPLKFDVVSLDGEVLSQLLFVNVRIRHESPEAILAAIDKQPKLDPPQEQPYRGPWRFTQVPPGFELEVVETVPTGSDTNVEHFVFSDGMASISAYLEPIGNHDLSGAQRMGAVSVLGGQVAGFQVTVVGEVPVATLQEFLAGIERADGGGG
jgi:sigma-E factor negative regulatory protein RseB